MKKILGVVFCASASGLGMWVAYIFFESTKMLIEICKDDSVFQMVASVIPLLVLGLSILIGVSLFMANLGIMLLQSIIHKGVS